MENQYLYRKVWANKSNGQKLITIPKNSDIEEGEMVYVMREIPNEESVQEDTPIEPINPFPSE